MSNLGEVESTINLLENNGADRKSLTLLHCTTEYPAPLEDVNLKAMQTMFAAFDIPVGYSDHTDGIDISLAAVALGATVIEKHITLDRNMTGPDHPASIEPDLLKLMVSSIRRIETAIGNGLKRLTPSEKKKHKSSEALDCRLKRY